jgi:hypothetical protein
MTGIVGGLVAGAAGTAALNVLTYLDMALRGRPESSVPAQVVEELTKRAGVALDRQQGRAPDKTENRKQAFGALSGYVVGLGIGALYGVSRAWLPRPSISLAGPALGLAAMAASDVPATTLGATNPKEWTASGWLSDLVPHLAYGLIAASTYEWIDAAASGPVRGRSAA